MVWVIICIGLLVIALTGVPIGIGLALTGLSILHFVAGGGEMLAITSVWNVFTDFTLSAVPLFVFMGEILLVSGVSTRIYNAVGPFFSGVPGKLLHTNIVVCTLFGAVCGASTSTAAAVGSVAYPELKKRGYDPGVVVATLAAGGTLGLLIPPSLSLLLYGATQGVSIGRLFLAGVVPGLMLAAMFMLVILVHAIRRPGIAPSDTERLTWGQRFGALLHIWPFGFLVFSVLGTMYMGLATATEAAALGVVASILVGVFWGDLSPRVLLGAFLTGTRGFAAIGIGCFFDGISLLLMTLPVVYPLMMGAGFDPVWTGVIITIMIEVGMLTPPVGMNLYVLTAITNNEVRRGQAASASVPYWLMMLLGILLLALFPSIALFLPNFVYG